MPRPYVAIFEYGIARVAIFDAGGKMASEVPGDETGDSDRGRRARPATGQDRFGIPSIKDATL
jgi:hypothetical protein